MEHQIAPMLVLQLHRGVAEDSRIVGELGDDLRIGLLQWPHVGVGATFGEEADHAEAGVLAKSIDVADEQAMSETANSPGQFLEGGDLPGTLLHVDHDRSHVGENAIEYLQVATGLLDGGERTIANHILGPKRDRFWHLSHLSDHRF